ncbi:MAG: hypothetical protein U9R68_08495, partial [Planctomycetota bacterium]|nr:hypothetical protein [Planctomycetota bacterium]
EANQEIIVVLEWTKKGSVKHQEAKKYVLPHMAKAESYLVKAGFEAEPHHHAAYLITIEAKVNTTQAYRDLDNLASALGRATSALALE